MSEFNLNSFIKLVKRELIEQVFDDVRDMWSTFDSVFSYCTIFQDNDGDWSVEVEGSHNFDGYFWIYSEFSDVQFHMKVIENENGTVEVVDFW